MPDFIITESNRDNAKAWASNQIDNADPTVKHVLIFREYKSQRSKDQNDWARKFARDFGKHFGYDADFAYDMLMFKCNPIFKQDLDGNEIRMAGHFSKLNTAEAAEVQELMIRYAGEHGFWWES